MRVVDLYLEPSLAEQVIEEAERLEHRVIRVEAGDIVHLRVVILTGSPDEFLEKIWSELDGDVGSTSSSEFYLVFEPVAAGPRDEDDNNDDADEDKDDEARASTEEIQSIVEEGAQLTRSFAIMSMIAGMVATAGLLRDNLAVVIGAMVLAPLYKPIAAAGAGIVLGQFRQAIRGGLLVAGTLALAAIAGAGVTWLTPAVKVTDAVSMRSGISAFDLIIALGAGIAMGYTLIKRDVSAMVGIVVAASLVPVASVCGIVFALGEYELLARAIVVLLSNAIGVTVGLVAICKFEQVRSRRWRDAHRGEIMTNRALWIGSAVMAVLVGIAIWSFIWSDDSSLYDRARVAVLKATRDMPAVQSILENPHGNALLIIVDPSLSDADRSAIQSTYRAETGEDWPRLIFLTADD
ncbi:MAG: TIGR00341 family protein, partial [Phycisphaerales bacterium]|nr:TIGR00341 family protein [Phycisphaerales bacterium]